MHEVYWTQANNPVQNLVIEILTSFFTIIFFLALLGVPKEDSRPTTPGGTVLPHAPVFKLKLNKETQLLEGTSVRFELVVRGNPEPKIKL